MQAQQNDSQVLQTPLISFIITAYNLPTEYLEECLRSILQLSLNAKEREIILIDDGSDTCPLYELAAYKDECIYLRQSNKGVSVARNMGLRIAKGKYIQFIDGDDYLIQAPYEHCLDLARYHNPDIVTFNFSKDNDSEVSFELPTPINGAKYLSTYNLKGSVCTYLFRNAIVGSLEFTPGMKYGEDEEFTPQLFLRAERIFKTETLSYYYRSRKDSTLHQQDKHELDVRMSNNLEVIFHLQDLLEKVPPMERQGLNRRIAQLTMDYIYNTIKLQHSFKSLNLCIKTLREHGLFPLPNKNYTKKYTLFRKMTNSYAGRLLLLFSIK